MFHKNTSPEETLEMLILPNRKHRNKDTTQRTSV